MLRNYNQHCDADFRTIIKDNFGHDRLQLIVLCWATQLAVRNWITKGSSYHHSEFVNKPLASSRSPDIQLELNMEITVTVERVSIGAYPALTTGKKCIYLEVSLISKKCIIQRLRKLQNPSAC